MRRWARFLVVLGGIAALGFLAWFLTPEQAGACTSVSSDACQPYLQIVRSDLGADAGRIANITSGSWCGQKTCQQIFGGDPGFRLTVTLTDGTVLHYSCGTILGGEQSSGSPLPTGTIGYTRVCSPGG